MKRLSITPKLTLVFVLFALVLLVGLSVPAYLRGQASLQAATVSELLSRALEKQAALDAWVDDRTHGVSDIASQTDLRELVSAFVNATPGSPAIDLAYDGIRTNLRTWVGEEHRFLSLDVIAAQSGRIIISTDPDRIGKFKESEPYFVFGKQAAYVQNPYHDLGLQHPIMTASAPIFSPGGELVAVLAGGVDMAEMNQIIQRRTGLRQTDDSFLVNASHLLVTQPHLISDPAVLQRGLYTEAVGLCLARTSGVLDGEDYNGVPAIIVYRWLSERQLCLITKISQDEAYEPVRALGISMVLIGGLVLLLGSVAAFGLSRSIARPIHQLAVGAAQIGGGNLAYRIQVGSRDEIGRLGVAFNEMAASLQRSLGLTAHSYRMLTALSKAAQAVQRATTTEEIYHILGEEIGALGYQAGIIMLSADREHLLLPYLNISPTLLAKVEKVAGFSAATAQLPLSQDGVFRRVIDTGQTDYIDSIGAAIREVLPAAAQSLTDAILEMVEIRQGIIAPLKTGEMVDGLLVVAGDSLERADESAVSAFASQTAIALHNVRTTTELKQHRDHLEVLVAARTAELRESEQRYRLLAETSPDMIFVIGRDDRIQYVNNRGAAQFGKRPEDVTGQSRMTLFPPSVAEGQARALQEVFKSGELLSSESAVVFPGGQMWLDTQLVPMRDETDTVRAVMGISRDVTERKRGLEALRENEERFRAIFERSTIGKSLTTPEGVWLKVNQAFADLLGYTIAEMQQINLAQVTHAEDIAQSNECARCLLAGEQGSYRFEKRFFRKNGEVVWTDVNTTLLRDEAGKPLYFITTIVDITESKRAGQIIRQEKALSDSIINSLPGIFYLFDAQGKFQRWNKNFETVSGCSAEEMATRHPTEFFAGEERQLVQARIQDAFVHGESKVEAYFVSKDGTKTPYLLTGVRTILDGEPCLIGTGIDITDRKHAEAMIQKANERFQTVMDSLDAAIYVADMETYEILMFNGYAREAWGDSIGKTCWQTLQVGMTGPCSWCTNDKLVLPNGEPAEVFVWEFENTVNQRWYECRDSAIRWIDGRLVRMEIATDITERKMNEDKLRRTTADLARSNSELERFAYVASHDLQEPLRMVTSYLQLLERRYKDKLDGDALEFIAYAVDGAMRMKILIGDLLAYSRVGTRGGELVPTDCETVLKQVLSSLQLTAEENNARITHDPLPMVVADPVQLEQLFQNLIGNGIKFHAEQPPEIHIGCEEKSGEYLFSVKDNGIGIDPQYFERIFIIFQRLHNRAEYEGTGIGLAISKRIAERFGGRLWVESTSGEGSTFYFTIPMGGVQP